PYGMIPNQEFSRSIQSVFPDRNAKLILHCQMGGRSIRATMELLNLGYTQVIDLRGGFGGERDEGGKAAVPAWKESGLPTESGDTAGKSYRDLTGKTGAPEEAPQQAHDHAGHGHGHGHGHGGHHHGEPAAGPPKVNRFADPERKVHCAKF